MPTPKWNLCRTPTADIAKHSSHRTPPNTLPAPGRPRASGRCAFPFPGPVTCRCPDLTLQPFLFSLPDTPHPSWPRRMAFHPWQCHTAIPDPPLSRTGHAMPFTCTVGTSYTPWEREWALASHVLTQGNYLTPLTAHVGCPRLDHPCEISKQCAITSVPPTEDLLSLWAPRGFPPSLIHTCYLPPIGSKIGHPKSLIAEWDTPTPRHVRYPHDGWNKWGAEGSEGLTFHWILRKEDRDLPLESPVGEWRSPLELAREQNRSSGPGYHSASRFNTSLLQMGYFFAPHSLKQEVPKLLQNGVPW